MMHRTNFCIIFALITGFPWLLAGTADSTNTAFDLFYQQGITLKEVELEFDLEQIEAHRRDEEEFPGVFRFTGPGGEQESWDIKLNVRGRYRRMVCDFPPLKINFYKDDLEERGLKKHNNLKLVTHCLDNWRGEDYLLREYVAYKMFQELFGVSYRAQLVRVRYIDSASGKNTDHYGIILEDEKELADRYDSDLCEDCYAMSQDSFDQRYLVRLDLFQFMIGNADWSAKILRNLKMLKPCNGDPYYLVPYDFDFSGIVDPNYVRLPSSLGIRSVRERVYLGFEHEASEFRQAYSYFESNQDELYQIIEACDYLSNNSQNYLKRYLNGFFRYMKLIAPEYEPLITAARK